MLQRISSKTVSAREVRPALAALQPVENATLALRVYRGLREMLMAGQVQPGQKLTLRELAGALGTSPMPVREAVQRLAVEGALEALPNRTIRVPVMTKTRFREVRRIRIALEGLAVEEATRHLRAPDFARLEKYNGEFTRGLQRRHPDLPRVFRANKELHFAVYEAAAMPVLLGAIESLWLQIGPVLYLSLRTRADYRGRSPAPDWHSRLLGALRRRDAVSARRALEGDLMSAGEQILAEGELPE
jgi:DNA-binding GntR family transcriptional regulator